MKTLLLTKELGSFSSNMKTKSKYHVAPSPKQNQLNLAVIAHIINSLYKIYIIIPFFVDIEYQLNSNLYLQQQLVHIYNMVILYNYKDNYYTK